MPVYKLLSKIFHIQDRINCVMSYYEDINLSKRKKMILDLHRLFVLNDIKKLILNK
jgi:hypothetical protein